MGADLYIGELHAAHEEKFRPQFDEAVAKRDAISNTIDAVRNAAPLDTDRIAGLEAQRDQAQAAVEEAYVNLTDKNPGYFRDGYNKSSVLGQMDLSWWADIIPLQSKRSGYISGKNLKTFRSMIAEAHLPAFKDFKNPFSDCTKREAYDYFVEKRQRLLDFIDRAITMKTYIDASL